MTDPNESAAPMHTWLAMPMESAAASTIERIRRADDVVHVAVMPDVHLANDVCVGTAMATTRLVYPSAVGGDIGCGMLAIPFDCDADLIADPARAGQILRRLSESIPTDRRLRLRTIAFPEDVSAEDLSHPSLVAAAHDFGRLQLGTLGGGNHFVELQSDGENRLWAMVHTGSRALGQAVRSHHLARATIKSRSLLAVDADTDVGRAYLHDQEWARRYAAANREAIGEQITEALADLATARPVVAGILRCDHNHVRRENHFGRELFVHRKGAMPADDGLAGIVPGSMGTASYHVTGRGNAESLRSSAHGAGRLFSRHAARERFDRADVRRQMDGVWYDPRRIDALREETPKAYKDVRAVMRAQQDLVRIDRTLRPVLVYKGT
jgi:tRNA-splicing ligase RtcB